MRGQQYLLQRKLSQVRARALDLGVPFDLRARELEIPAECPVLGVPMDYSTLDRTPSLDRVDQRGGYTKENVRVISFRANTLRGNANWAELLDVAIDAVALEHGKEKARECAEALLKVLGDLTST